MSAKEKVRSAHRPRPAATQSPGSSVRAGRCVSHPSASRETPGGLNQDLRALGWRQPRREIDREAQRGIERHGHDAGNRFLHPLADEDGDDVAVRDRQHAPIPRRAKSLPSPFQLRACSSDHRPQPRVERSPHRLAWQQHAFLGEGTNGNRVRARVAVRRRERGQERLVPQRVDANAVSTRGRRRLHHSRRHKLTGRDPPQQLGRHVLVEPNLYLRTLRRHFLGDPRHQRAVERPVADSQNAAIRLRRVTRVVDGSVDLSERPPRMLEESRSRRRQLDAPRGAGRTARARARAPARGSRARAATATCADARPRVRNATPRQPRRNTAAAAAQSEHPLPRILNPPPSQRQRSPDGRRIAAAPCHGRPRAGTCGHCDEATAIQRPARTTCKSG